MKKILMLFLITFSSYCFGQISYEKGYYIDSEGKKVEGLIKDMDWNRTPQKFNFKLNDDAKSQTIHSSDIIEFGIYEISKFQRYEINLDITNNDASALIANRDPNYELRDVLLEVLVQGKANLYYYSDGNIIQHFYNTDDNSSIRPLTYKKYLSKTGNVLENNDFRKQLFENFKCKTLTLETALNLNYNKTDLIEYFQTYNACHNVQSKVFKKQKRDIFDLTILGGYEHTSIELSAPNTFGYLGFNSQSNAKFGLQLEYILPFNKNKWSVILQAYYQSFTEKNTLENTNLSGNIMNSEINYKSIEVPLGLRHSFFLNNTSKLSLDFSYVFDFTSDSKVELTRGDGSYLSSIELKRNSLALGLGYTYNDRYSIVFRYLPETKITTRTATDWDDKHSSFSLLLGYKLF